MKKDTLLTTYGIICVSYWFLDFLHNAVIMQDYTWIFWYSSAGFLITGITLIIQNIKLIYSLFCALFAIETAWILDAVYIMFTHRTLFGLTEYFFSSTFQTSNLYITLYHALIPVGLFLAVYRTSRTYNYGWIGAACYATTLILFTYLLTDSKSQVNCVHILNECHTIFSFLYRINDPYRIIVALLGLTIFVFIPTNRILIYVKKKTRIRKSVNQSRKFLRSAY